MQTLTRIQTGYTPGAVGRITAMHGEYYNKNWGFGIFFETKVATELSLLLTRDQDGRSGFWTAEVEGTIAGGIAVDGNQQNPSDARLRFFIVSPACQGLGLGNALMEKAIDFCRQQGFETVFLETFEGLDAARHLYEKWGFRLIHEQPDTTWGVTVNEQRFERRF